jgi:hypothetical protein
MNALTRIASGSKRLRTLASSPRPTVDIPCKYRSLIRGHVIKYMCNSTYEDDSEAEVLEGRISALRGGTEREELTGEERQDDPLLGPGKVSVESLLKLAEDYRVCPMTPEINTTISKKACLVQERFDQALNHTREPQRAPMRLVSSLQRLLKDTAETTSKFALKGLKQEASVLMVKANARNLQELAARHGAVVETMTEIFASRTLAYSVDEEALLAALYEEQIALSILIQHGAELSHLKHPHAHGVVRVQEPVQDILHHAATLVTALAGHNYSDLELPAIETSPKAADAHLTCIPGVVEFAIVEALKNAIYATMEHNGMEKVVPPVIVEVNEDNQTLCIDILDAGPGISRTASEQACAFAGAASTSGMVDEQTSYQPVSSPLRGFHVGIFLLNRFLSSTNSGSFSLSNRTDGNDGAVASLRLRKCT